MTLLMVLHVLFRAFSPENGSIFEEKEMMFARQLLAVQHRELFSLAAVEEVITAIYSCISGVS